MPISLSFLIFAAAYNAPDGYHSRKPSRGLSGRSQRKHHDERGRIRTASGDYLSVLVGGNRSCCSAYEPDLDVVATRIELIWILTTVPAIAAVSTLLRVLVDCAIQSGRQSR